MKLSIMIVLIFTLFSSCQKIDIPTDLTGKWHIKSGPAEVETMIISQISDDEIKLLNFYHDRLEVTAKVSGKKIIFADTVSSLIVDCSGVLKDNELTFNFRVLYVSTIDPNVTLVYVKE